MDVDHAFSLLAARHRRLALYHLSEAETATVAALARRVAELDDATRSGPQHTPTPTELEIELRHVHLPKLAAASVVDYDAKGGEVHYRSSPLLADLLDEVREYELGIEG